MSNPYLPRIGPAIGAGFPGLPQRAGTIDTDPNGPPLQSLVIRAAAGAQQTFVTPAWARRARVTALGRGGQGLAGTNGAGAGSTGAHGGAGAGLAASLIEDIPPNTGVEIAFTSTATLVGFLNYSLSGGNGGNATTTSGGAPGIGSGGAINFNGGAGGTGTTSSSGSGGGGAAGRAGNGVAGSGPSVGDGGNSGPGDAYATGGGAGGAGSAIGSGAGNIGLPGISRTDASLLGAALIGSGVAFTQTNPVRAINCDGGDGGGGSGGALGSPAISNIPGAALVLIELW